MRFERLHIEHLRCLERVEIQPGPGLNFFSGANGAGKTSLLEAACLLSYARSFRPGSREALMQHGASRMHVFGEIRQRETVHRLGLGRESGRWSARVDGQRVERLSALIRDCAVVCFEPGSHALIAGPAEERRRFLDWGVFHVEQGFLETWQRYRRALKQRNSLLRQSDAAPDSLLAPWERELGDCAQRIDEVRKQYLQDLQKALVEVCRIVLPELGGFHLDYRRGWDSSRPLQEILQESRERDRLRGHTIHGIHRADWRPAFEHAPLREHFSRGQEKLCALACTLAQARVFRDKQGEWPVVCLDDLASELDAEHQESVIELLSREDAQVWLTGTSVPAALAGRTTRMFHVEHGQVRTGE